MWWKMVVTMVVVGVLGFTGLLVPVLIFVAGVYVVLRIWDAVWGL